MHLGVNATLEAIEGHYSSDSMRCLTEVLAKWLKGEGSPPTWKEAVRTVISLSKHNTMMENIKQLPSALIGNIYVIKLYILLYYIYLY